MPPQVRARLVSAFGLKTLGVGLLFGMQWVLARRLSVPQFGTFNFVLSLVSVLAVLVSAGWPSAITRFVAQYVEEREWGYLRGVVRRGYQVTLLSAAAAGLVLWALSLWTADGAMRTGLRYGAAILVPASVLVYQRKAFTGLQRTAASIVPEEVVLPLAVIAWALVLPAARIAGVLGGYLAVSAAVAIAAAAFLWRRLPGEARGAAPRFRTRHWTAVALPMVVGSASQLVMNRIDVLMLGSLAGMAAAGLYTAASRVAMLNIFALAAINTVTTPLLAAAYFSCDRRRFFRICNASLAGAALGALPFFLLMVLAPGWLLGLFGAQYRAAGPLLQVLALGQFVNAATGPVGFALLMAEREREFARSLLGVAVLCVLGHWLVIPRAGALGAAWVSAGAVAALNVWQFALCRRITVPAPAAARADGGARPVALPAAALR
jgi:O-antigen/teichoic acid export membrane protein